MYKRTGLESEVVGVAGTFLAGIRRSMRLLTQVSRINASAPCKGQCRIIWPTQCQYLTQKGNACRVEIAVFVYFALFNGPGERRAAIWIGCSLQYDDAKDRFAMQDIHLLLARTKTCKPPTTPEHPPLSNFLYELHADIPPCSIEPEAHSTFPSNHPNFSPPTPSHAWCTLSGYLCTDWRLRHWLENLCSDHSIDYQRFSNDAWRSVNQTSRIPLNAGQDSRNIICWGPSILQNIQTKLAGGIDVGMEHLADELDCWRLIRVLFFEMHDESEGSVLEWRVRRTDNDGVPVERGQPSRSCCFLLRGDPYQVITLSATGEAETPAGGSVCIRCRFHQSLF